MRVRASASGAFELPDGDSEGSASPPATQNVKTTDVLNGPLAGLIVAGSVREGCDTGARSCLRSLTLE
jgi:hypothetical protein